MNEVREGDGDPLRRANLAVLLDRADAGNADLGQRTAGAGDHARDPHDLTDLDAHFFQGPGDLLDVGPLIILYCSYKIHRPKLDTTKLQLISQGTQPGADIGRRQAQPPGLLYQLSPDLPRARRRILLP